MTMPEIVRYFIESSVNFSLKLFDYFLVVQSSQALPKNHLKIISRPLFNNDFTVFHKFFNGGLVVIFYGNQGKPLIVVYAKEVA